MTDQEILNQIQVALMEPPDNGATFQSDLWTRDEVLAAMNERQNRFLKRVRTWVGIANIDVVVGQAVYALPEDWLTTVAVTWFGVDGTTRPLERSDSFEADHGLSGWPNRRGTPELYMSEDTALLSIQIAPAPDALGHLELLYIPQAALLTGDGEPFQVTDEYAHAVGKYGTLADLLAKDGRGKSPEKAAYAETRFNLAAEMAAIVLNGWS